MDTPIENPLLKLKFDMAQNTLYGSSAIPSLRNLIATRVAIFIWQNVFRNMEEDSLGDLSIFEFKLEGSFGLALNIIWKLKIPDFSKQLITDAYLLIDSQVDKYFSLFYNPDVSENVNIYLENLCWTQQGTINILKTAESIITNTNLNSSSKYHLACNNCLKEYIYQLYSSLPNNFIDKFIGNERHLLVLHWTFQITCENKRLFNIVSDEYNFEDYCSLYMLNWAIKHKNEVAVQYFWENIASDIKDETPLSIVGSERPPSSNIKIYFVTLLKNAELEEFCQRYIGSFLLTLPNDIRWKKLLCDIIKYILQFIESMDRYNAVHVLSACFSINILDGDEFTLMVKKYVNSLKTIDYISFAYICENLISMLFTSKYVEIQKVLLRKVSFDIKKRYLYDDFIKCFSNWILYNIRLEKYQFLDVFLGEMLDNNNEEIRAFKHFFSLNNKKLFVNMIMENNFIKLDGYMEWLYGDEKHNFKRFLPYDNNSKLIIDLLERVLINVRRKLSIVKMFIKWCFDENVSKISEFKVKALHLDDNISAGFIDEFLKFNIKLIIKSDLHLARIFFRWGVRTSDKDLYFKRKVLITEKLWHVVIRDNNLISKWKWFLAFTSLFLSEVQIVKFKQNMRPIILRVLIQYLIEIRSEETNILLDWYFTLER